MGIECLREKICTRIYENYPQNFTFEFGEASLAVDCFWRLKADGRITLTSSDHGQKFGLSAPVDAYGEASSRLQGRRVMDARLNESTADLILEFDGGQILGIFTDSSGYVPWNLTAPGVHLVALGAEELPISRGRPDTSV